MNKNRINLDKKKQIKIRVNKKKLNINIPKKEDINIKIKPLAPKKSYMTLKEFLKNE
tara:strand:- start:466 stop:636 length:171 start_codon:yes stop_codon:yes gene_type:complete